MQIAESDWPCLDGVITDLGVTEPYKNVVTSVFKRAVENYLSKQSMDSMLTTPLMNGKKVRACMNQ